MTYYDILEVSPTASQEVIKNAYKALAQKYHPDNFASDEEKLQAEEQFKRVTQAYEILGNKERRKAYDEEISRNHENPKETILEEKYSERSTSRKLQWVGVILLLTLIGTGAYLGFQYQHKQAIILAEKKAEDEVKKELAVALGKEALYLTLTVANNIDFQITPYEEGEKHSDPLEGTLALVKSKQKIIERGKIIQGQRRSNVYDISRIASSMRDKDLQDVTLKFQDMLLSDCEKFKIVYDKKLLSSNLLLNILSDTSSQNNITNDNIEEAIDDLSSKELLPDNPSYGVTIQAIIGVLEREMGKDSADALIEEGEIIAKEKVAEDLKEYFPEIYEHFQTLMK